MKNKIFISFAILSIACNASKNGLSRSSNSESINYVLPDAVTSLLSNKINSSSYFCLYSDSSYYDLYIGTGFNEYASITNRRLFVKGLSYPLIFDYDMHLGTITPEKKLVKQYNSGEYLETTKLVSIHEGFHVRFKKNSNEIISSGYALEKTGN